MLSVLNHVQRCLFSFSFFLILCCIKRNCDSYEKFGNLPFALLKLSKNIKALHEIIQKYDGWFLHKMQVTDTEN